MTKKCSYAFLLIGLSITNSAHGEVIAKMNIVNQNREVITRYFEEVWNNGNLEILDQIISSDYINHNPGFENPVPGAEGLKPIVSAIRKGFPDLKYIVKRMVVDKDYVAVHVIMTGTHAGNFFGIPATGKTIKVSQMQIERIVDGKIAEHWRVTDDLSLMSQLGQRNGEE